MDDYASRGVACRQEFFLGGSRPISANVRALHRAFVVFTGLSLFLALQAAASNVLNP